MRRKRNIGLKPLPTPEPIVYTSKNNDGWTGRPCPDCTGAQYIEGEDGISRTCGGCGGTGEYYVSGLDLRDNDTPASTPIVPSRDRAEMRVGTITTEMVCASNPEIPCAHPRTCTMATRCINGPRSPRSGNPLSYDREARVRYIADTLLDSVFVDHTRPLTGRPLAGVDITHDEYDAAIRRRTRNVTQQPWPTVFCELRDEDCTRTLCTRPTGRCQAARHDALQGAGGRHNPVSYIVCPEDGDECRLPICVNGNPCR